MRTVQQLFDGLSFTINAIIGLGRGLRNELCDVVKEKTIQKIKATHLVSRQEYNELRVMVEKLRQQQENTLTSNKKPTTSDKIVDKDIY